MSSRALGVAGLEVGAVVSHLELESAWAVDPVTGREGPAAIAVEGGLLDALVWRDAGRRPGIVVAPGFIDLHAHFREPGFEDAETIATGQAAAAHGGFTTVCVMPNTAPPLDEASTLRSVLARAAETGIPVRILAWAAASRGREGRELAELGDLAAAGALGYSDDGSPIPATLLRNVLAYAGMLERIVVDHPEERELTAGAEANEGLVATILGLKGWPRAAEESAIARDIALLGEVLASDSPSARLHLTHVSTAEGIDHVRRAKATGLRVSCDVTPHHLALTEEWIAGARRWAWEAADGKQVGGETGAWGDGAITAAAYDTTLKVNPPLRTTGDARALLAGLRDGTVDAVATDHAPHTLVDKQVEFGLAANGISGIETALGVLLEAVAAGELGLMRAIEALTVGPWRVLAARPSGDPDGGDAPVPAPGLEIGRPADLVVFDPSDRWLVAETALRSLGKNTPLLGRSLPGRVLATVARGRLAYLDPELAPGA